VIEKRSGHWRVRVYVGHPTQTGSRNLLACACSCGRKLRVAKATLEQAPIVCGACAEPFEPV